MKYAVIRIDDKQYKVAEGDEFLVEKIDEKEGKSVTFDKVLLLLDSKKVKIGQPLVSKAYVKAKIIAQLKSPKIRVAKFRSKSRYRKVKGHRQLLTKLKIIKIYGSR